MQRLTVNPQTLAMALGSLHGTPEEVAYFATQLQRSCAAELALYQTTPPADAPPEVVQAHAQASGKTDWGDTVHPHVVGQILVDLCERTGQPVPDNLYVYHGNDWVPLHNVQPSAPVRPAAPAIAPALTPAQLASPAPDLQRVEVLGATILKTAEVPMPQPGTLEGMIESATGQPTYGGVPVPDMIEEAEVVSPAKAPASAPAPAAAPAPAPAPVPQVVDQYGLPVPTLAAPKGKSPFDTHPGGKVPGTPPDRALRDILAMATQLFSTPAAVIVKGDGKGVVQRQRVFSSLLLLVDQMLGTIQDPHVPIGALQHYVRQLRYEATQTPGADVMLEYEKYLFQQGKGDE